MATQNDIPTDSLFNARHALAVLCAASAADPEILLTHTAGARAMLRRIDADLAEVERIRQPWVQVPPTPGWEI